MLEANYKSEKKYFSYADKFDNLWDDRWAAEDKYFCKAPSAKYVNCIPEKGSHLFQDVEVHMKMFPWQSFGNVECRMSKLSYEILIWFFGRETSGRVETLNSYYLF